LINKSC